MISKLRNYAFTGFLIILPLMVTIFIIKWFFIIFTNFIIYLLPQEILSVPVYRGAVRFIMPILLLVVLLLTGMIVKVVFLKKVLSLFEALLLRVPLFNKIYSTIKQISIALLDTKDTIFNRVVLFEYPCRGLYTFGFVTSREKYEVHEKTKEDLLNIFIGTSPNPITGFLLVMPKKDTIDLKMRTMEGMKMIVTAGVVSPVNESFE